MHHSSADVSTPIKMKSETLTPVFLLQKRYNQRLTGQLTGKKLLELHSETLPIVFTEWNDDVQREKTG